MRVWQAWSCDRDDDLWTGWRIRSISYSFSANRCLSHVCSLGDCRPDGVYGGNDLGRILRTVEGVHDCLLLAGAGGRDRQRSPPIDDRSLQHEVALRGLPG